MGDEKQADTGQDKNTLYAHISGYLKRNPDKVLVIGAAAGILFEGIVFAVALWIGGGT